MKLSNTPFAPLVEHLLDLLHALEGREIPFIIAGGFGLFLRRQWIEESGARTLISNIPPVRATEDFDVVLKLEVLADRDKLEAFASALNTLGYEVVAGAEKYQFKKPGTAWSGGRDVKVDLLARQPDDGDQRFRADNRRVRPRGGSSPLHAHTTPEAIAVEDDPLELSIEGNRSDGEPGRGIVFVPQPYALLLMKLFAFRDEHIGKKGPGRERFARKHAGDLFTITAMLTPDENDALPTFRERYGNTDIAREAAAIVQEYFSETTSPGVLRLREQIGDIAPSDLDLFLGVLRDTFPLEANPA